MLFDIHRVFGYSAITANFLAGLYTLGAWRWPSWRTRWLWAPTIVAESMMMIQVLLGVLLVSAQNYEPPRFHMFYGFVAFITVGIAYSYRFQMRGRLELLYGLVGLFLMGVGIRAILQAG